MAYGNATPLAVVNTVESRRRRAVGHKQRQASRLEGPEAPFVSNNPSFKAELRVALQEAKNKFDEEVRAAQERHRKTLEELANQ